MPDNESRVFRSEKIIYTEALWDGDSVAPALWNLLNQRDRLIEITSGGPPWRVVLGAPHHAAPGVNDIADRFFDPQTNRYGRPADETVGLLALAAFAMLQQQGVACKLLIAAHATDHDPNKTQDCPYWKSLLAAPHPALVFELHGAAGHRRHDLELSAGQNTLARPLLMGRQIARHLPGKVSLAAQSEAGEKQGVRLTAGEEVPCRLENPALKTSILKAACVAGLPALHLEARPIFRQLDPAFAQAPRPTPEAWNLARALAAAFREELG